MKWFSLKEELWAYATDATDDRDGNGEKDIREDSIL